MANANQVWHNPRYWRKEVVRRCLKVLVGPRRWSSARRPFRTNLVEWPPFPTGDVVATPTRTTGTRRTVSWSSHGGDNLAEDSPGLSRPGAKPDRRRRCDDPGDRLLCR